MWLFQWRHRLCARKYHSNRVILVPSKACQKAVKTHTHYHKFIEYGNGESYKKELSEIRRNFSDISN